MAPKKRPKARKVKLVKDEIARIRISAEHKRALIAAAEREGLDLSSWLRRVALREAGVLPGSTT